MQNRHAGHPGNPKRLASESGGCATLLDTVVRGKVALADGLGRPSLQSKRNPRADLKVGQYEIVKKEL